MLPLVLALIVAIVVLTALMGALLAALTPVDGLTAYLATTPGGLFAVLATAADSGSDVTYVTAVQIFRLLVILLLTPVLARRPARLSSVGPRLRDLGLPARTALRVALLPPGRSTPLAERHLRGPDAGPGAGLLRGAQRVSYVAAPRHQHPLQLGPPVIGHQRVGREPPPAVDHDVAPVGGRLRIATHPATGVPACSSARSTTLRVRSR